MYADFVFLMSHSNVRNLGFHAYAGIALFVLFVVHHLLNLWFYKMAFRGKFNTKRIVLNVIDWILFVLMILMTISSVFASGAVFEWSPLRFNQFWRTMHLMSTSWAFMIMSFHLALHFKIPKQVWNDKGKVRNDGMRNQVYHDDTRKEVRHDGGEGKFSHLVSVSGVLLILYIILILTGYFAFFKSQIYVYLFNTGNWKMAAPNLFVSILEYVGITAGIISINNLLVFLLKIKLNLMK